MSSARKIIKNMFSLSLAEIANKGIALITAAYLTRAILVDGFGIIGFAGAITAYFIVFITFGFTVVGVREIAKSQEDIPKFVNSIVTIRLIMAILSFIILIFIVWFIDKPAIVKYTILCAGFSYFAQAIVLDWVYQGIERMEIQAFRQVITSLLTLIGTVILVHRPSDVVLAMAVTVLSAILNSIWMMAYYIKLFGKIKLTFDKELWVYLFKSSIPIGLTNLIIINYNYLNTVLLGFFRNNYETGIYTAAYKILVVMILPSSVIQNAFFPVLSRADSAEERIRIMRKYSNLIFLIAAIVSGIIFTYADYLVIHLWGKHFSETSHVLKILMFTSVFMYVNVSFTAPLMAWNKEKAVLYAIIIGGIFSAVMNFAFIPFYGYTGAAYVTAFSEFVVMCGLIVICYKTIKKIFIFDLFKYLVFSSLSCIAGYFAVRFGISVVISALFSCLLFAGFNFIFRTVTISEIKGYFSK